jgi:integrase
MGVRRDPQRNNRWYYEFWIGDVRYRGYPKNDAGDYVTKKSEAQAAEVRAREVAKVEQGMDRSGIKPGSYLLIQAIDRHIGNLLDASESHLRSLRRIGSEMVLWFGKDRAVIDIMADGPKGVDAYRAFLVTQKRKVWLGGPRKMTPEDYDNSKLWKETDKLRSASEVNHCLDLLRCAFKAAHNVRDPRTNKSCLPFPVEVEPVEDPERDPTPMSQEEFRARLAGAPQWVADAANLAWHFGLRLTEALTLDLRHLDHESECLRLSADETKSGKDQAVYGGRRGWVLVLWLARRARKRGQTRLVMWPGPKWLRAFRCGEAIPNDAWQPLKTIRRSWTNTIDRAEIEHPKRFHDLRAAYITNAAKLGSSTLTKGLARHASMATTERYIKIVEDDLARAANRAAEARPKLRVVR